MRRIATLPIAAAIAIATFSFLGSVTSTTVAQDITITVKKNGEHKIEVEGQPEKKPFTGKRPAVDVAILLDTSSSMNGLINQAKTQLWNIVQQFADAEKQGMTPILRVSVFEYGNSGLPATEGYIRQVVQLTDDLDRVSEALFGLQTGGGDEYCGMVIHESLKRLDWSQEPNSYKAIFIAGNEPFTQGSYDYKQACQQAIQSGVVVNTIHCGNYQQGISGMWKHGADLAEGEYLNIDQDQSVVQIKCPQDKIIIELNNKLNKTYLWYGQKPVRQKYKNNQAAQDANAAEVGGFGGRAQTKLGSLYRNVGRDLVDTLKEDESIVESLKAEELPDSMKTMSQPERLAYIQKMAAERAEIKKKMAQANKARLAYIEAEKAKMAASEGKTTLGDAVSSTVRKQLEKSGFNVKNNK